MNRGYTIRTADMHTAGEPLRIIESIQPAISIEGSDILAKISYIKTHLDWIRKLIIDEPRGHRDMYGALILDSENVNEYDFGVIFMHNNGYSTMCGHGVIALARYAIDKKMELRDAPNVKILCPCGIVECTVTEIDAVMMTTFVSVPSFLMCHQLTVHDPSLGTVAVDISYGGAFYAIVHERDLGVKLRQTDIHTVISLAQSLKNSIISTTEMKHPYDTRLEFLYGVIITEDVDEEQVHRNLVIFADKEVDRSPCGSGVSAVMAALFFGDCKHDGYHKSIIFQNSLLKEKSQFIARIKEETNISSSDNVVPAVRVEVSGCAFYTGRHEFFYELTDPLKYGFQIYL